MIGSDEWHQCFPGVYNFSDNEKMIYTRICDKLLMYFNWKIVRKFIYYFQIIQGIAPWVLSAMFMLFLKHLNSTKMLEIYLMLIL